MGCKHCGKDEGLELCVGELLESLEGLDPSLPVRFELVEHPRVVEMLLVARFSDADEVLMGFVTGRRLD